jgi:fumarylacetoacetate (FAA) hydrolase
MRLVSYLDVQFTAASGERPAIKLGALVGGVVIDLSVAQSWAQGARGIPARDLPGSMTELLMNWDDCAPHLGEIVAALDGENPVALRGASRQPVATAVGNTRLLSPLPRPLSFRDFMSFEGHVKNSMALRGRDVRPQWYEIPVFYFSNVHTFYGHDEQVPRPASTKWLDYELELACIINKAGINIPAEEAPDYIAGYTILNDWSARDIQLQEMAVGLGPAKGKDFANSLGPALVTPDELADKQIGEGAELRYDLEMVARINGEERSRGNFKDIHWTFSQMIARASEDVHIYPGEVIGSGTVGTGCLLEQGAQETDDWLKPGDVVELEIERLGVLRNQVVGSTPE